MAVNRTIMKSLNRKVCKIVVGGEGGVGKTTLCQRLAGTLDNENDQLMTIGVDFHDIKREDENLVEVQVWDLGGQEHFRCFQKPFFKKTQIVILVFSVEWYETLICIDFWLSMLTDEHPIKIFLIGNKVDSLERMVTSKEALEFAKERNLVYYEISALGGKGFEDFKEALINTILSNNQENN